MQATRLSLDPDEIERGSLFRCVEEPFRPGEASIRELAIVLFCKVFHEIPVNVVPFFHLANVNDFRSGQFRPSVPDNRMRRVWTPDH